MRKRLAAAKTDRKKYLVHYGIVTGDRIVEAVGE
jgi:hypothetical protein